MSDKVIVDFYYLAHRQLPRLFSLNIYIDNQHDAIIYPVKPTKKQIRHFKKKYIPKLKSAQKRQENRRLIDG
ncbi:DUF7279 family protein [Providencia sp. PROV082]|uniref:DUF7279 family protein n=1 Tax=Providencia TaxID=586 RepID=UPI003CE868A6